MTSMIIPPFLKKGDTIGIVATAKKVSYEELLPGIHLLQSWGLEVKLPTNIFNSYNQFAGTDQERRNDFQQLLDDIDVKAILCARGGYGTVRIIDQIDFSNFKKNPKWIAGFSDITVFHSHIHSQFKTATIHSAMAFNVTKNERAAATLKEALFGTLTEYKFPAHDLNRKGGAESLLVGGNLSLLYALNNTASDIDTDGKILFLEDLDEYLYHIDRMMLNLKRSGKLAKLKGLIIGGMSDMKDNAIAFGKTAEEIILDAVNDYDFPVCFNFPAGHIEENRAIYLGREITLKIEKASSSINFRDIAV